MDRCDNCNAEATNCIGGTHYHCSNPECERIVTIDELVWSGRMTPERAAELDVAVLDWKGNKP